MSSASTARPQPGTARRRPAPPTGVLSEKPQRLVSLDAYRGAIMILLASAGFGIARFAVLPADAPGWERMDYAVWQDLAYQFKHTAWISNFRGFGIPFWDLIQPAFMFMVGVAMPYSYARRKAVGHSWFRRFGHALWRSILLILLGVFLSSQWEQQTNWVFVNVLCQIGLGYLFVILLLNRAVWLQLLALTAILVGYWGLFFSFPPPADFNYAAVGAGEDTILTGVFAPWSKNSNIASRVDVWLLNQFPRAEGDKFEFNEGGYATLNFVPSIGTMLLGLLCGELLRSNRRSLEKLLLLIIGSGSCLVLGMLAAEYACPVVKRIWTPSWVLLSGGWVILILAAFYLVFDLCRLRWLAFPLVIVGMNSLAMYMMGQLMRPWAIKTVKIHFTGVIEQMFGAGAMQENMYGELLLPTSALIVFWLIALWMYRQKYFIRA